MAETGFEYDVFETNTKETKAPDKESTARPEKGNGADTVESSSQEGTESSAETKARAEGWRPKDEWQGDESEWVTAREFNFRGDLMKRIQSQTRRMKDQTSKIDKLVKAIKTLGEHNEKLAEHERKKALEQLKAEKRNAEREGEYDRADLLDEKIEEVRASTTSVPLDVDPPQDSGVTTEVGSFTQEQQDAFYDWTGNQDWYQQDAMLRGAFHALGDEILIKDPSRDMTEILDEAKKKLVSEFPTKFGKPSPPPLNPDSGRSADTSNRKKPKYSYKDLNDEYKEIVNTMWEAFGDNESEAKQKYVNQLVETGTEEAFK
jgi:hypothetical protein